MEVVRYLLLEPAMGFGPTQLVLAPEGLPAGARLPAGVRVVERTIHVPKAVTRGLSGFALPASPASSRRGVSLAAGALPTGGRGPAFLLPPAPVARRRGALDSAVAAAVAGSGRRGVAIGATPRELYRKYPDDDDEASDPVEDLSSERGDLYDADADRKPGDLSADAARKPRDLSADADTKPGDLSPAASREHGELSDDDADRKPGDLSAAAREPGNLSAAASREHVDLSDDDTWEFADDEVWEPPTDDDLRAKRHISAWVELARLQTTFQVAFDAGLLESGRDLRRILHAIGDIDITAPSRPFSAEHHIGEIIGTEMLDYLKSAKTPKDDIQFWWSALASQGVIECAEDLMGVLFGRIITQKALHPTLPLSISCPVILKQLLKVVCDCSTIIESTKFRRPQNSIRFRMLEAHALSLEHVCVISLDVYEETCQQALDEKWLLLRKQLMNRRVTLFEQDIGMLDYLKSVGLEDTERVAELVEMVAKEVKKRVPSSGSKE